MSLIQTLTKKINGVETEIAPRTFASAVTDSNGKTLEEIVNSEYELIEEITLTEDVANIERSVDPNNIPYSYKNIFVQFAPSVNVTGNPWILFKFTCDNSNYEDIGCPTQRSLDFFWPKNWSTDGSRILLGVKTKGQLSVCWTYNATTNTGTLAQSNLYGKNIINMGNITSIKLTTSVSGGFPTGSVFKIYAIRN